MGLITPFATVPIIVERVFQSIASRSEDPGMVAEALKSIKAAAGQAARLETDFRQLTGFHDFPSSWAWMGEFLHPNAIGEATPATCRETMPAGARDRIRRSLPLETERRTAIVVAPRRSRISPARRPGSDRRAIQQRR